MIEEEKKDVVPEKEKVGLHALANSFFDDNGLYVSKSIAELNLELQSIN